MRKDQMPPHLFQRFFRWYCRPTLVDHIEGDLLEVYGNRLKKVGKRKADFLFVYDVLLLFRPSIIRPTQEGKNLNTYGMYKSYFKIGCRNLFKNTGYSFINISGLALGMTVAVLIGLWAWDELSFNKNHANYDRIAAVMQNATYGENISTWSSQSIQLGPELRNTYGNNFKYVVMSSIAQSPILTFGDKAVTKSGDFMEADGPQMLSLDMLAGSRSGLKNPNTILLARSTADALFGEKDPMGEILKIDNQFDVTVTGVYRDLPPNSSFSDLMFVAPLDLLVQGGNRNLGWVNNWLEVFVQLEDNRDMASVSMAIKDAKLKKVDPTIAKFKPELFLYPMSRWRLYSGFENGVNTGGRIIFVWLFGAIGVIVLLLACINFMNLSTARSEKRAKEVGIRKVVGSLRSQLIGQFLSESFLIVLIALVFSIILVQLSLPWFNVIADKQISADWTNYWLWLSWLGTGFMTAVVAGSYPAFYLSGFRPGTVLKGTTHFGSRASLPRKALVVIQFTVSVTLIIGTAVVYEQIQYARNRPLGYTRNGLVFIPMKTAGVKNSFETLMNDLLMSGKVSGVSRSECMATNMYWSDGGLQWKGKDPDMQDIVHRGAVDFEFGKTVGWKIKEGRDFSRDYASDSSAMILNEAAVAYMGLKNPVGEIVNRYGKDYTIIGVIEDMVSQSLYRPSAQTYYVIDAFNISQFINIRINPELGVSEALLEIEKVFRKTNPATPFEYRFADEQIADKFAYEARVGKLAGVFAALAVIISCLGLFGLAAFIAEQRTKEIGIRKVVGASVFGLWKLLSKDFLVLVSISCFIAIPISYYFMDSWLQQYDYRTNVSMGLLVVTCLSAMAITLLAISYQSIKAATMNPVKSLRSE